MPTFGVIAEGVTDQQILERFLSPLCAGDDKPIVNFLQPPDFPTPGNWDKVFKYIASERFQGAFQFNDFVAVHVDTDVCEDFVPPIPRTNSDGALPAGDLIEQVKARAIDAINQHTPGYYEQRQSQILFAIAVHSIECWILPLYCERNNEKERQDNCLNLLNQRLKPRGFSIDENNKGKGYTRLFQDDKMKKLKRKVILEISHHNPGFTDFVAQVEAFVNTEPAEINVAQ